MFGTNARGAETKAKLAALDRVQAVIEFDLAGTILGANENFLKAMGYELAEIVGKHHRIFVDPAHAALPEYLQFWSRLRDGEFQAGQFKRFGKGSREVWIEASYNPLLGRNGKPYKIIKFATDITTQKVAEADRAGQLAAIRRAQAVIEFTLDGVILDANDNFLATVGYRLDEIKGKHHAMFVEPAYKDSTEYREFWAALRRGEYNAAQFKRLGKGGRAIWIQASYNPILDASGRPYKVVKFATDITTQVELLDKLRVIINENFGEIDEAISQSAGQARDAGQAASSAADNVQTMAAASEELAASVAEVSASMAKSRDSTERAASQALAVAESTGKLSEAASSMTGIVNLIQNIAAQINLLALNATIESARAGEAGRGFAVVAQEVKNLANQAAKATEQIGAEIDNVQSISGEAVTKLQAIQAAIDELRVGVTTTASAVEEQSAVTRDMSMNMQQAARATTGIAENITSISAAVTQVANAVSTTRDAARVLAH